MFSVEEVFPKCRAKRPGQQSCSWFAEWVAEWAAKLALGMTVQSLERSWAPLQAQISRYKGGFGNELCGYTGAITEPLFERRFLPGGQAGVTAWLLLTWSAS